MNTNRKILLGVVACWAAGCLAAQTTPKEVLGFNVGDDYHVANYTQFAAYLERLARESPRMKLKDIGLTAEGRHQYMAVITSAENQKRLDKFGDLYPWAKRFTSATETSRISFFTLDNSSRNVDAMKSSN